MSDKDLTKHREKLTDEAYSNYYEVENELEEFANKLSGELVAHKNVAPYYELGVKVNAGQQFNVGLRLTNYPTHDILLRAYVPDDGYPVTLNYVGHEVVARDKEELLRQLYEVVPTNPDVMSRLRGILAMADNRL